MDIIVANASSYRQPISACSSGRLTQPGLGENGGVTAGAAPSNRVVRRIVGVYDADGAALGEVKYFVAARLGRAHCALCDITHGRVRATPEWRARRDRLPTAFDTFHRDDQPEALRGCALDLPVVAAETEAGFVQLLGPEELTACHGSVGAMFDMIEQKLRDRALVWPR
jgi:hypothetical protein